MLKGHWLFFQADTLALFHDVLSHTEFAVHPFLSQMKNHAQLKCFRDTARMFVELVRRNPLAIVEAMFRYQSVVIKEAILNNYEEFSRNDIE